MVFDIESGLPSFFVRGRKIKNVFINNPNRLTLVEREEYYQNEKNLMMQEYDEYLFHQLKEYFYDIGQYLYLKPYSQDIIKYTFSSFLDKFRCQEEYINNFEYIFKITGNPNKWILIIFDNPPCQIQRQTKFSVCFDENEGIKIDRLE